MSHLFQRTLRRRGATALEFALLLPVLTMLIFGSLEYSWYLTQVLLLNLSVSSGVYQASLSTLGTTDAAIIALAKTQTDAKWASFGMGSTVLYASSGGLTVTAPSIALACYPSTITAIGCPLGIQVGSALSVNAAIAYVPLFGGLVPSPPPLRAQSSMLLEP